MNEFISLTMVAMETGKSNSSFIIAILLTKKKTTSKYLILQIHTTTTKIGLFGSLWDEIKCYNLKKVIFLKRKRSLKT